VLDQLKGKWDDVKPSLGQMPQDEKPLDPKNPIDNIAVATVALVLALEASAAQLAARASSIRPSSSTAGPSSWSSWPTSPHAAKIHDFTEDEMTGAANRAAHALRRQLQVDGQAGSAQRVRPLPEDAGRPAWPVDGSISGERASRGGTGKAPAKSAAAPSAKPSSSGDIPGARGAALAKLGNVYAQVSANPAAKTQYMQQYPGMFDENGNLLPRDVLIQRVNQRFGG
jgi:hypothetical protein